MKYGDITKQNLLFNSRAGSFYMLILGLAFKKSYYYVILNPRFFSTRFVVNIFLSCDTTARVLIRLERNQHFSDQIHTGYIMQAKQTTISFWFYCKTTYMYIIVSV